jgi:O-antigen ligase
VFLFQAVVLLLCFPIPRRTKFGIVGAILVLGLAGFTVRYLGYFKRGAPSAVARTDYWKAAWITFTQHPLIGSGPGTFSVAYKKIKPPDAEMALLTHNDYLQQASDSGIPGFLSFGAVYAAIITLRYRKSPSITSDPLFVLWLGLVAWAAQALTEFGLYIPALAWPAFLMMGWLLGTPPPTDSHRQAS